MEKRRSFCQKRGSFSEECGSFSECYRKAFGRCGAQRLECCGEDRVSFSRAYNSDFALFAFTTFTELFVVVCLSED